MFNRLAFAVVAFVVGACGGGGGGGSLTGSINRPPPVSPVAPPVTTHGSVAVGYETHRDGVTGETLAGFLTHHRRTGSPYGEGTLWGSTPPVVRVASGATAEHIGEVRRAVDIINSALPPDWQMTFDPTPRQENQPFGHGTVWYDGEITVNYAPSGPGGPGGFARASYGREAASGDTDVVVASRVSIATDNGGSSRHRQALVIHEIGHTLGIGGDTWADIHRLYPASIMTYLDGRPLRPNGAAFLWPLDRDSFRALYSVLEPGMTPDEVYEALGAWEDSTVSIRGTLGVAGGAVSFGASGRNGFMDAWSTGGAAPGSALADNAALSGSAEWNGRLLGIDDESRSVAGAARLSVDLATSAGDMAFTGLESWTAAPGAVGTGTSWGDGSLTYSIAVQGNAFRRTGGDDGALTGRFVGPAHEGMAGMLTRNDLAAGFGGTR